MDFTRLLTGVGKSVSDRMIERSANNSINKISRNKSDSSSSTVCGDKEKITVNLKFK